MVAAGNPPCVRVRARTAASRSGALLLAGLAVGALAAAPGAVRAHPGAEGSCQPSVSLAGSRREVVALARALARFRAPRLEASACHRWAVTVWRTGPRLTVELADEEGVNVVRHVRSTEVAAALIDAWRQRGMPGPPSDPDPEPPPPLVPPAPPATDAIELQTAAAPRPEPGGHVVRVLAGPDVSIASDRSVWGGGHVGACATWGRACAGVMARADVTQAIVGDPGTTSRYTADVLASLAYAIPVGRLTLVPLAGVGAGLLQANTSDPGSPPGEKSGARRSTTWGFRMATGAALVMPLARRLALAVGGSFDLSLPARGPASDGQGGLYPAEPRFFLRGGVALSYEAL